MNAREALIRTISEEIARTRTTIERAIADAIAMSERETLAVGRILADIVGDSKKQVDALDTALRHLEVRDTGEPTIGEAIAAQSEAVNAFVSTISTDLRAQGELATRAATFTAGIASSSRKISQIAGEVKILAINSIIESSRLGAEGASFRVIAKHMKDLSAEVQGTNAQVADVASQLSALLPDIASRSSNMTRVSEHFSTDLKGHLSRVEASSSRLRTDLAGAVTESRTSVKRLLGLSEEALSHLQYQDVVANRLRGVVRAVESTSAVVESLDGAHVPITHTAAAPKEAAPELEAGEVALF